MKTLLGGCALVATAATGFYLTSEHITSTADGALLIYVGAVSTATAILTTRRTYKWTALGVGLLFSAIAIAVEGLTNGTYQLGWLDPFAVYQLGPVRVPGTEAWVGPWTIAMIDVLDGLKALVRALLMLAYTYLLIGLIQNRVAVYPADDVDTGRAIRHAGGQE
jgi:hypothetical protein